MKSSNMKWVELVDYLEQVDCRNTQNIFTVEKLRGVTSKSEFDKSKAKTDGVDLSKYKIVLPGEFAYNPSRINLGSIAYNTEENFILSPMYIVFKVREDKKTELFSDYLFIWFMRKEFMRSTLFYATGSVRDTFDFEEMGRVRIPLPSIEEQHAVVDAWKSLRNIKEQNEILATHLMQLCQSYIQDCKHKYPMTELRPYIEEKNIRNENGVYGVEELRGVTSVGVFDKSKANTDGLSFSNYKIVSNLDFAYNPSRINIGSIAINKDDTCIISPMYIVFSVSDANSLLPEYLALWTRRKEFQRSTLFYASGSVRDTFNFSNMQEAQIPLPPIEKQQAIVALYQSALEYKAIAAEADKQSRSICPALMQHVINL